MIVNEIHFAVPFDHALFVEAEVLGAVRTIRIPPYTSRLEFPRDIESGKRALWPPVSAPFKVAKHLPEGHWGIRSETSPKLAVEAALVVVLVNAEIDFDLAVNQVGGDHISDVLEAVSNWFDSFCHWLWVLTAQSLDPVNPDPKVLHRRSRNVVVTASASGQFSVPASGSPAIKIVMNRTGPACERLVDRSVLDMAVQAAGTPPPMALVLLASARMAARRSDRRRALVDAGTAAEAALSEALRLGGLHQFTLGALVTKAKKRGLSIPSDTQDSLVAPRNNAVHRGRLALSADIDRALEVAEELVWLAQPKLIRVSSLTSVNRPQRHDIVMIRPP